MRRSKTSRTRNFAAAHDDAADEDSSEQARAERAQEREKEIEIVAVRLLARREHSKEELRRKLISKGYPEVLVAAVVEKLGDNRQVSDERFAASYVHHHAGRGQGPVRIRAVLRQQGIADPQIQQEVGAAQRDWKQLAGEVRRRKFGTELPRTAGERAKQARFLQYRGFNSDQIRAALSFDPELDADPSMEVDPGAGSGPDHC